MTTVTSTNNRYPHISPKLRSILESHLPKSSPEFDPSTLSNYTKFTVSHTILDLDVLFERKKLVGSITLQLKSLIDTDKIVLDTSYLKINNISINKKFTSDYKINKRIDPLGSSLEINYKANSSEEFSLKIDYETTDDCTALQWLDPQQTDGKKSPYLFSQCEPIHARSFFPCFDTPSIKSTFTYYLRSPLNILTSGLLKDKKDDVYHFEQPIPIPSYLVSIASGDITDADIGPRSKVYSEPSFIDSCQYEFENDTEKFIQTAESIVFPYEWKDYDVLILPSSMPFGGMEHPNCTFATPTLISGDRENIDVIAHELAHSWSGNLVTNCSFEHFWLNEGWTVYLERRIQGKLHGESFRHFNAIIGWNDLTNSIISMGQSAKRFSTLIQDLKDQTDPDDSFSTVPYEKGFNLLFHIEQTLGSKEAFDPFIKYYFNKYKYKSLDSYEFLDTLYGFYSDKKDLLDSIDWKTWLYEPGLPPKPKFDTTLVDECYDLAAKWIKIIEECPERLSAEFNANDIANFGANQNGVFLDKLVSYEGQHGFTWKNKNGRFAIDLMSKIYSKYPKSQNAEVIFRWFRLLLTAEITSSYQHLADWLGTVGRMKFVRPSYTMLNLVDRPLALETFKKYEMIYHPICRSMVKKDLGIK
jgi:leukotriene-A4 hydrolase